MGIFEAVAILLAGVGAGAINAVVGSGTLITFPILLSFGFPPVTATISNSLGLVPGSFSGTWGYRRELAGQKARVLRLIPASLLGALTGAFLLLNLPESAFEAIVPVLLVVALVMVVTQTRIQKYLKERRERREIDDEKDVEGGRRGAILGSTYLIGCYGGYFAAAQGILLVGLLGTLIPEPLQRINALKNLLTSVVNSVAATTYIIVAFDRISWSAAGLIAVGSLFGGLLGSAVGRKLNPTVLRAVIVVLGIVGIWRILAA